MRMSGMQIGLDFLEEFLVRNGVLCARYDKQEDCADEKPKPVRAKSAPKRKSAPSKAQRSRQIEERFKQLTLSEMLRKQAVK